MSTKRDKEEFAITRKELRALLFWASIGVCRSRGGSYSDIIQLTIAQWTEALNLNSPYHIPYPIWRKK